MRILQKFLLLSIGLFCLAASIAAAGEDLPSKATFSTLRLLMGQRIALPPAAPGEAEKGELQAGVQIRLEEGWKTYWRSPGDAGFPLRVEVLPGAVNIESVRIEWPYARRFVEEWGLEVFGFKQEALVPLYITLADVKQPVQGELRVSYAVCSDICINEERVVTVSVPAVEYAPAPRDVKALAAAQARIPAANGTGGVTVEKATIESEDAAKKNGVLVVETRLVKGKFLKPELFVESAEGLRFPRPEIEIMEKGKRAVFRFAYEISPPAKTLEGLELRLTLVHAEQAVETTLTAERSIGSAAAQGQSPVTSRGRGLWESIASNSLVQKAIFWR